MTACAGCSAWLLEVDFGLSDDVRNQQSSSKDLETEPRILLLSQLHRVSLCRSRRTRKSAYTQLVIYVSIEDHSAFWILRLARFRFSCHTPAECDTRKLHGSACSADSPARWLVFRLWFVDNCSRYLVMLMGLSWSVFNFEAIRIWPNCTDTIWIQNRAHSSSRGTTFNSITTYWHLSLSVSRERLRAGSARANHRLHRGTPPLLWFSSCTCTWCRWFYTAEQSLRMFWAVSVIGSSSRYFLAAGCQWLNARMQN